MKHMKLLWIVIIAATALVTLFSPSAGHAATRARNLAETVLNDAQARLAAGSGHTCQVNDDGTVRCWGSNSSGQIGDGTSGTNRRIPVPVSGLTNAVAIAAGGSHTCALLASGTVSCWGLNGDGRLGDGTQTDRPTPVPVSGLFNAVAIATGGRHSCALLASGTARCWGSNNRGQLGDGGGGLDIRRLTSVPVILENAVGIAALADHTCALLGNGSGVCWGDNSQGQLGDGTHGLDIRRLTPVPVSATSPTPSPSLLGPRIAARS